LWPGFLANIVYIGGNSTIEGFIVRLQMEIRAVAPAECIVRVARPDNPIVSTWKGGANLATDEETLSKLSVTKQEYDEYGAARVARRLGGK
jgi:actin-related protein 6